jgi:hypothetical protein
MEHKLNIEARVLEEYDTNINQWESAFWRDMGIARINHDIFFQLPSAQHQPRPYKQHSAPRRARLIRRAKPVTRVSPCAKPTL